MKSLAVIASALLMSVLIGQEASAACSSGIPRPAQTGGPPQFAPYPNFTLDFLPLDQPSGTVGHMPACIMESAVHTLRGDIHPTHTTSKFLTQHAWWSGGAEHWQGPQIVSDGTLDYYHVIIGSEDEGFVQEYYIPLGYSMNFEQTWRTPNPSTMTYLWAPHQPIGSSLSEPWLSASGGSADVKGAGTTIMDRWIVLGTNMVAGNAMSPLEDVNHPTYGQIKAGNGSGNPNRVIMRQLVTDGEMRQDFVKSKFSQKPRIYQKIETAEMVSIVDINMEKHNYSDMSNANVTMVNTLAFTATGPENQQPAFWTMARPAGDMPSEKAQSYVTAGQYIYTGGDPAIGYANGQYKYAGDLGGFKLESTDWTAYMDLCDPKNIWSYDNYRPASPTCF